MSPSLFASALGSNNAVHNALLKVLSAKAYLQSVWAQFDRPLYNQVNTHSTLPCFLYLNLSLLTILFLSNF